MAASTPATVTRGFSAVVANGGTVSTALNLGIFDGAKRTIGFIVVGTILSTSFTMNISNDGVNFFTLTNEAGSSVSITCASNVAIGIKQDISSQIGNWPYMQLVMGSTETNGATIQIIVK